MIITIDGPASSGKSTVARLIAQKLNFDYLSTGIVFRALAYMLVYNKEFSEEQLQYPTESIIDACLDPNLLKYTYDHTTGKITIYFNGKDITPFLKNSDIDTYSSMLATNGMVRKKLLFYFHHFAKERINLVVEGRDCGTVVFPQAQYKFFLMASPEVRALRWQHDQQLRGNNVDFKTALRTVQERDKRDTEREIAPLAYAPDAMVIDNSDMTINDTVGLMLSYIKK